jgi:hypothetical protein
MAFEELHRSTLNVVEVQDAFISLFRRVPPAGESEDCSEPRHRFRQSLVQWVELEEKQACVLTPELAQGPQRVFDGCFLRLSPRPSLVASAPQADRVQPG